jgi:hypothetical protein
LGKVDELDHLTCPVQDEPHRKRHVLEARENVPKLLDAQSIEEAVSCFVRKG